MTQKIAGNQASFLGGMATGALPTTSCQTTLERYTGRYDLDTTNNNSDLHKKDVYGGRQAGVNFCIL